MPMACRCRWAAATIPGLNRELIDEPVVFSDVAAREACVFNTLAAGRRLAARLVVVQLGIALLVGLIFMLQGRQAAFAAAAGATLVALGTALLASRALVRGGAVVVLTRVLMGTVLKWLVVIGGLYLLLARWHLPPLPALVGVILALAANLMALRFKE